jgi:hypothetical protein
LASGSTAIEHPTQNPKIYTSNSTTGLQRKKSVTHFNAPLSCRNGRVDATLTELEIEHVASVAGIDVHCKKNKGISAFYLQTLEEGANVINLFTAIFFEIS